MKYILMITVAILIFFTFKHKDTPIKSLASQDSILAFGDSLTYGFSAKSTESYPAILTRLTGLNVINAGVNGDTSQEGLRRLPKHLEDKNIKLMILFFGGNDIMQKGSMSALKSNLKEMIGMAKEKNITVLLVSVPNLGLFGLSPLALYEELAEEEEIPLLSGMLSDILSQPSLKSDQIHPNALGYKQMAEEIYEKLNALGWVQP